MSSKLAHQQPVTKDDLKQLRTMLERTSFQPLKKPVAELLDEREPDGLVVIREEGEETPKYVMTRQEFEVLREYKET